MRELVIYAVAMGLLAFGGGPSSQPLPTALAAPPCDGPCAAPGPGPVTKF